MSSNPKASEQFALWKAFAPQMTFVHKMYAKIAVVALWRSCTFFSAGNRLIFTIDEVLQMLLQSSCPLLFSSSEGADSFQKGTFSHYAGRVFVFLYF